MIVSAVVVSAVVVVGWLVAAVVVGREADPRLARRKGVFGATAVFLLSLAAFPGGLVCTAFSLAGVLVTALSPVTTHPPRVLARALVLVGLACAFTVADAAAVHAVLWAVTAAVAWSAAGGGRLFAVYHVPSALVVASGLLVPTPAGEVLVLLGVAVRAAAVPVHSWFPWFVARTPMGVVAAFLLPLGLVVPKIPAAAVVGGAAALLGAVFAVVQADATRALAFLLVSVNGVVLVDGVRPAAVVAVTGLAMTVAALTARRGALSLGTPAGDLARTPRLAVAYLGFGLVLAGFPLLPGFANAHRLLDHPSPFVVAALVVAVAVNGITVLRGYLGLFAGRTGETGERDLTPLEHYAVAITLSLLALGGLAPGLTGW
ncbi:hypothetical protein ABZ816_03440 [Actinosynnema sp. NPDC047251]|uniref:NADH:quinone oxidoreductase/Mrp antiporter membrane subunit domain-containing protein n=1 Tax=Saccharothrix espanaensis (strain ATCC 51144 / DSM 44229 / JCM 9112 / NBRC 15066 / NRRL 15764) TaxID=1179773 RepID=K0JYU5_SACES|nr:hypothetical protein [Saccharothrix espanaensis]CCH31311.1 hypothetical protein BN6_40250 [Saccharothrix espanaensis DSM 44229]